MSYELYLGDCLNELKNLKDNSIDSCVTDPPYGLSFMGKHWDYDVPRKEIWEEVLRVLKPGGHLLSFGGSRTYHRMAVAIEDAGFEIRDQIMWLYGTGFPKSHNIGKAIDKMAGATRKVVGARTTHDIRNNNLMEARESIGKGTFMYEFTEPETDDARKWEGWGTALKPAHEPIVVARKPFNQSVAANVLEHGTGALNIKESMIACDDKTKFPEGVVTAPGIETVGKGYGAKPRPKDLSPEGRWPANIIHDGSDEVLEGFPYSKAGKDTGKRGTGGIWQKSSGIPCGPQYGDEGSAARFFYCAKASKSDRDEGLEEFLSKKIVTFQTGNGASGNPSSISANRDTQYKNVHPTVKPTNLMKYLIKLVTPKGGTVLDPFMGSGSTGKACGFEDYNFIGMELDPDYYEIAKARIEHAYKKETVNLENWFE
jgi:site-specific DNA-methyltransferase (adenine-specific)